VDPISDTPTARSDYALLSLTYLGLLAGAAETARRRQTAFELGGRDLLPLSAATFALSKMIVHEKVEAWMRGPFVEERAEGRRPRGRRLRYAVGELLTCTRCTGAWGALGLVALRTASPSAGRLVTTVLAASAGNDFLHSGFSWLCARGNMEGERAELKHLDHVERDERREGGGPAAPPQQRVTVTAR
jgi:Protein of unknown function (DUF1360)